MGYWDVLYWAPRTARRLFVEWLVCRARRQPVNFDRPLLTSLFARRRRSRRSEKKRAAMVEGWRSADVAEVRAGGTDPGHISLGVLEELALPGPSQALVVRGQRQPGGPARLVEEEPEEAGAHADVVVDLLRGQVRVLQEHAGHEIARPGLELADPHGAGRGHHVVLPPGLVPGQRLQEVGWHPVAVGPVVEARGEGQTVGMGPEAGREVGGRGGRRDPQAGADDDDVPVVDLVGRRESGHRGLEALGDRREVVTRAHDVDLRRRRRRLRPPDN